MDAGTGRPRYGRMTPAIAFWRRLDSEGLERLQFDSDRAYGVVIGLDAGGYRLQHAWRLDPSGRALSLVVERIGLSGAARVSLERDGDGWRVDGVGRPDLDGALEPDLSVTPFCNSLAIRRLSPEPGATLDLDAAYVDGATLSVVRSRQRYERLGPRRARYLDLGVAAGFTAVLDLDADGLVGRYQRLFERLRPAD